MVERYLQRSRAVQRRVQWMGLAGVILTLALVFADAPGMVAFAAGAVTLIFAASGLWITQAHIDDFQKRLRM